MKNLRKATALFAILSMAMAGTAHAMDKGKAQANPNQDRLAQLEHQVSEQSAQIATLIALLQKQQAQNNNGASSSGASSSASAPAQRSRTLFEQMVQDTTDDINRGLSSLNQGPVSTVNTLSNSLNDLLRSALRGISVAANGYAEMCRVQKDIEQIKLGSAKELFKDLDSEEPKKEEPKK